MPAPRTMIASAKLIAVCTVVSRITGLLRDMLLVQSFGLGWVQDSFKYAFQIPNLFRRLFGEGALSAAFVPMFSSTLERDGPAPAWRLLARSLALMTVALIVILFVVEGVIFVLWLVADTDDPAATLPHELTALMLPFMLTICVVALFASILNCLNSFVVPALMPVLMNIVIIVGLLVFQPTVTEQVDDRATQVFGVAASVLVAGVLQLAVLIPVMRAHGVPLGWSFAPRDPQVRTLLRRVAPVSLGQGVLLFGVFLDTQICILLTRVGDGPAVADWFGWRFRLPLEEGALSTLDIARNLYNFPLGVLAISLATAALPTFSRLAARAEWSAWRDHFRRALRLAIFEGLLAGGMMIVLAAPIVRLLFEYNEFGPGDTQRAAHVLRWYGVAMWAFCAQHIVLRGFYSVGDVRTPLWLSGALMPLNVAISVTLLWFESIREAAFAISSAVTAGTAVIAGLVLLKRRAAAGRILDGGLLSALGRMLLAAVVASVGTAWLHGLWQAGLAGLAMPVVVERVIDTFGGLLLGCLLFAAVALLLGLHEPRAALRWTVGATKPRSHGARKEDGEGGAGGNGGSSG